MPCRGSQHIARYKNLIGCKFVNLSTQNESLLRGYIFQEERRQRQQQKDR